jgi:hypothetical protein
MGRELHDARVLSRGGVGNNNFCLMEKYLDQVGILCIHSLFTGCIQIGGGSRYATYALISKAMTTQGLRFPGLSYSINARPDRIQLEEPPLRFSCC